MQTLILQFKLFALIILKNHLIICGWRPGFDKILEAAGFELRLPSCSACLAMNPDKVPAGKLAISTSNRNFVGRQGPGARTVLASPLVVAASAITGVITDPRKI